MTSDKLIRKFMDELNQQKITGQVITRPLTNKVELARIWPVPVAKNNIVKPLQAYFIKEDSIYIGAVLEEENSLFAYMQPTFRRKGHMSSALKQTILPHILQKTPVIRLHFSAATTGSERFFNTGRKLALKVGFINRIRGSIPVPVVCYSAVC